MFTVLVKKSNGNETLYSCDSLEKEENALLMWGDHLGSGPRRGLEILGPGGQMMAHDWDRKLGGFDPHKGANIYVMNTTGATVARYHLNDSTHEIIPDQGHLLIVREKNDSDKVIYWMDQLDKLQGVPYFRPGMDISLFDLAQTSSPGFPAISRTAILADGCELTGLLVKVLNRKNAAEDVFKVPVRGIFFKQLTSSKYERSLETRRELTIDPTTLDAAGAKPHFAQVFSDDPRDRLDINVPNIWIALNLATGMMRAITTPAVVRYDSQPYDVEVVGYSIHARFTND